MWDIIVGSIFKVIDKVIPDPQEAARQKLAVMEMQQKGEFLELEKRFEAIVSEARSTDPWTSRARPSFMYVFYAVIISLGVIAPVLGVFNPTLMTLFFQNVAAGFAAIPEAMWTTFTIGYVGYTVTRGYEKKSGVAK